MPLESKRVLVTRHNARTLHGCYFDAFHNERVRREQTLRANRRVQIRDGVRN